MSRKNRKRQAVATIDKKPNTGPTPTVGKSIANDAFQNLAARTGFGSSNLMEATNYILTRLTQNYTLMNTLYRGSWLARRIVDLIPKDMMKNGHRWETDMTPEQLEKLAKAERRLKLKQRLLRGLNWGRLYGGAAGLMLIEGQEDLEEPLDVDALMPGDFHGLLIFDRWAGVYPQTELVDDIADNEFGLPRFYHIHDYTRSRTWRVHHSRLVRFVGDDLPEFESIAEMHWGASVIESVYDELKKRDNTSANLAGLIFLSQLRVLKMEELGEVLGSLDNGGKQHLYNTLQAQNWLQSNFGMYLMSKEDDFQTFTHTFSGLNDIYESFMLDVAGAAQIPVTKLFGRAPAGLNSTGEADMRNYYDVVEGEQESKLKPALEKLFPVLCMSTLGFIPEDWELHFNPVYTPSEKEAAEVVKTKTEAILTVHDRGIVSDQVALKELKQMGDGTGMWSNIADEDIAKANAEVVDPLEVEPSLEGEKPEPEKEDNPAENE